VEYSRNIQTTTILGTVYILPKVIMQNYKTCIMGNNITCIIYRNYEMPAILCTQEMQVLHVLNCKYPVQ